MFNYMIKQIDACKIIIVFMFNYAWFEPRVPAAQPGHQLGPVTRLGRPGPFHPMHPGLDPALKKPNCICQECVWQNTPLCLGHNFYVHSSLMFGQMSSFSILENSKNIQGSSLIYLWVPRTLFYFFYLCLYFFLVMCSICGLLQLNANMSCKVFFISI